MLRIARQCIRHAKPLPRRYSSSSKHLSSLIDIQPEILSAIRNKQPVVALESTIITHGMPFPYNLETAIEVEDIIRAEKALPATIAVLNGRIKVGLTKSELNRLAVTTVKQNNKSTTVKVSRRDLAYVLSRQWSGGTTVAGTLIIANMVGIKIFATGGIGGVHRNGENTMDISADLVELGRSPIAVVSAGVKSILDIPRTLEFLETQGVTVTSYQSPEKEFPAFYSRTSGSTVPYNLANAEEAAALIASSAELELQSGILIGVPAPEQFAMSDKEINNAIDKALVAASEKGITGKDVTPFILSAVSKITEGRSLITNIALIKNNARVAAQIAVALSNFEKPKPMLRNPTSTTHARPHRTHQTNGDGSLENIPVVIGGSVVDTLMTVDCDDIKLDCSTYPSKMESRCGGVGRNIAEGLYKMFGSAHLITAIGTDANGKFVEKSIPPGSCVVQTNKHATGNFAVLFDRRGDCKLMAGDMNIHREITPDLVLRNEDKISKCPLVVMDTNIPIETMETLLKMCLKHKIPVFFEPTDPKFAGKPFELPEHLYSAIRYVSPNVCELETIVTQLKMEYSVLDSTKATEVELLAHVKELASMVNSKVEKCIVTLGSLGAVVSTASSASHHYYPTEPAVELVNVSGAGDSFVSGYITALLKGHPEPVCVAVGFKAAHRSLLSQSAVPDHYFQSFDEVVRQCLHENLHFRSL